MNSKFTDIFIRRPVLATVVSLLLFLVGIYSIFSLQIREFPQMETSVITVTTAYPGASADVMQGFVTSPLQRAIASSEGIDYMTSTSAQSTSTINVYVRLNYDAQKALTNVMSKVSQVSSELPPAAQQPVIQKSTGSQVALMYLAFKSDNMNNEQVTDYLMRVIQPKLETLPGVAQAQILGGQKFAMRVWIDPTKLAAYGLSVSDVIGALQANNYQTAAGSTKGKYVSYDVNALTDAHDVATFKNLVIKNDQTALVRLSDVADVELGAESYDFSVYFDGEKAVFMAISTTPEANPLTVASELRNIFPSLNALYPSGFSGRIVYDGSNYISSSIKEVARTIIEATLIVILVIFLFLGSLRTVFIPVVTIPLSLAGVCALLLAVNYSINLMTLLAMVLAIGLVVDDAIVVVENVYRHLEEGMKPFDAAIKGAREIANPVIVMTLTLAAVYAPIAFMGGVTGALFREFAFTLAMTVIISGFVALTLSPMMASKILSHDSMNAKFALFIDRFFMKLKDGYRRRLSNALQVRPIFLILAAIVLLSCGFMAITSQKELAPQEDQGFVFTIVNVPSYANLNYIEQNTAQLSDIYKSYPAIDHFFTINQPGMAFSAAVMKTWDERTLSQKDLQNQLQGKESGIAGVQAMPVPLPSIPSPDSGGFPVQLVITTTNSYEQLFDVSEKMLAAARQSGLFIFATNDLSFDKPQLKMTIDKDKVATMGIRMQDIGSALSGLLGGNYINFFSIQGQSYDVIPQVPDAARFNPENLTKIYVRDAAGDMIPLSNFIKVELVSSPGSLNQFQQLNAATIGGAVMPGHTSSEAIDFLKQKANEILPRGFSYDFAGESRQSAQEGNTLVYTFFFSLIIIYLVLAAQFESFRDPLIILVSVPMSLCGALLFINVGLSTLNIYSGIGLVTLIGLITKHGILMVDFANQLQREKGLSISDAITEAASIRLRPILMTTLAMIFGMLPLLIAKGPGAVSRFDIGLVIATGMLIGTIFTLFVLPVVYTFLAHRYQKGEA